MPPSPPGGGRPPPAPVDCPRCGGAARREGIDVEEVLADCPFCGRGIDLAAPAAGARGSRTPGPPVGLACPKCGAAVTEDSVEYLNALARCRHCTTVLDLSAGRNADWYRRRMAEKEGIPLPRTFRVTRSLGSVTLEWMAFRPLLRLYTSLHDTGGYLRRLVLGVLCLLVVWTVAAIVVPDDRLLPGALAGWGLLLLPVIPLSILRRRVAVGGGAVRTGWGPLLGLRREVPASAVEQLFVVYREVDADRTAKAHAVEPLLAFDLMALAPDGTRFRLLGPFAEREEALYLERWLERRLGIEDHHVDGEMLLTGSSPRP